MIQGYKMDIGSISLFVAGVSGPLRAAFSPTIFGDVPHSIASHNIDLRTALGKPADVPHALPAAVPARGLGLAGIPC